MTAAPRAPSPARFAQGERVLAGVPATVASVSPPDALGRRAYDVEVWAPALGQYVLVRVPDEAFLAPATSRSGRAS